MPNQNLVRLQSSVPRTRRLHYGMRRHLSALPNRLRKNYIATRDCREKRDTREKRDPKFEVPKTSNFGPLTVVRLAPLARLAFPARRASPACLALHAPRPVALADFFNILLKRRNRPLTKPWERNPPGMFCRYRRRKCFPALRLRNVPEGNY